MDYSKFDSIKACEIFTLKELELILFKSRIASSLKFLKKMVSDTDDLLEIIVVGSITLLYTLSMFLYSLVEGSYYLLTHTEKDKSPLRYSEIKWNFKRQYNKDNEYTSIEDIQRLEEKVNCIKAEIISEDSKKKVYNGSLSKNNSSYFYAPYVPSVKKESPKKLEKEKALSILTQTFENSNILCGVVISTEFRNVKGDELLQYNAIGEFSQPYLTQVVSFGEEINKALKILLQGKIKFHTKRKDKKSYVRIDDGDLQPLIQSLQDVLGMPEIKISLIQDN